MSNIRPRRPKSPGHRRRARSWRRHGRGPLEGRRRGDDWRCPDRCRQGYRESYCRRLAPRRASLPLDVTDDASWQAAVLKTIAELGGFDILVNNAGVEITSLVINVEAADLRRMCERQCRRDSAGHEARVSRHETGRARRQGRRGHQHCVRRGDHRFSGHRRLFRDQVGRRPADPGRRDGSRASSATASASIASIRASFRPTWACNWRTTS